jgi:nitrogen regulatory protein P-II 2
MHTTPLAVVTIIAEPFLEERLIADLHRLGATGHTVSESHGAGSRGVRATDPPGLSIRIEVVCSHAVADRILEHLATTLFEHYAVIAWMVDARVARGEKFV